MAEPPESHFTILVRLPFSRGEFVDPPPPLTKAYRAETFEVTQPFLLQQAAWLYERQLSQVRAQMRKVGTTAQSASPPTGPGSISGSTVGGFAMKRGGSGAQAGRRPSVSAAPGSHSRRTSLEEIPKRVSKPPSKPASKESLAGKPPVRSEQKSLAHPEGGEEDADETTAADTSSEEEAPSQVGRRTSYRRRGSARPQPTIKPSKTEEEESSDSDDSPAFLPFASTVSRAPGPSAQVLSQSPSATLRGVVNDPSTSARPTSQRRATMERIPQAQANPQAGHERPRTLSRPDSGAIAASTSSMSESFTSSGAPRSDSPSQSQTTSPANPSRGGAGQAAIRPPGPISPRRARELAAAGLSPSPRRRNHAHVVAQREGHGSDGTGTPSMGSSFSDLDGELLLLHGL
ncbi:MAG: hypothetical protein Q9227_009225 [Pyrenula ochraceoflavens]